MKRLILFALALSLLCPFLRAQDDDDYLRKKKRTFLSTGGTSVTVNMGLPGGTDSTSDSDNGLFVLWNSFTTPAGMTSPSWGVPFAFWESPDSGNPNWGVALYDDASAFGTVTTSGATVTWSSGTQFNTSFWANGTPFYQCPTANTCQLLTVSSVASATSLTLTTTPTTACASACNYQVATPAGPLCKSFTTTVAVAGWNQAPTSGGGAWSCSNTPSSSHRYWLGIKTNSTTQLFSNLGYPCEFTNNIPVWEVIGEAASFTSNSGWPANPSTTTAYQVDAADGCISSYIPLTYTTTNRYTIVTSAPVTCDTNATVCNNFIPAIPSNATLVAVPVTNGGASPITSVTDLTSGTTHDTLTKRGTNIGATSSLGIYEIDRATSGVNEVKCAYTGSGGSNKTGCSAIVIVGTQSSSFDQNCFDSSSGGSTPYTGCTTGTTSVANEITFGATLDDNSQGCCAYTGPFLAPTNNWIYLYFIAPTNSSAIPSSVFYQVLTSTGTVQMTGKIIGSAGSPAIRTSVITLE